jgi:hypothetical protein
VIADDPTTPGEIEKRQVLQTFVRQTNVLVDLYVDGEVISTTEEHPFWVPDKGWVEAGDLQVGDLFQTEDGINIDIDWIGKREGEFEVYNFEVEDFHTYFVSNLEILVHNACNYDVIIETMDGTGNITSAYNLSIDDALDTGQTFLGPGYTNIGLHNSGVSRSADGLRQFRIDEGSITGGHPPDVPHVHLEIFDPSDLRRPRVNNHIPII